MSRAHNPTLSNSMYISPDASFATSPFGSGIPSNDMIINMQREKERLHRFMKNRENT
jgi:hypothetical protein